MSGYSHSPAYDSGMLAVGSIHSIYYEQYEIQMASQVLIYLHGGPGDCISFSNTRFFDPMIYRVVLLDQRGCGKSTPHCELRENTTQYLVSDIESLRKHLNIEKWHLVFGGSWGSTLSLMYAETHPERVLSLIVRGIFLGRKLECDYGNPIPGQGTALMFPDAAEEALAPFSPAEQKDWLATVYKRMLSDDQVDRIRVARIVMTWDMKRNELVFDPENMEVFNDDAYCLVSALFETHYVLNGCFIREGQILEPDEIAKIQHIPCTIVQGRYDVVCPPVSAWDLHKALPNSKCIMVPDAGHSASEPSTFKELVKACDEYGRL